MKGFAELSILIFLLVFPIVISRRTIRYPIVLLVGAMCFYWVILLYIAPRLPE